MNNGAPEAIKQESSNALSQKALRFDESWTSMREIITHRIEMCKSSFCLLIFQVTLTLYGMDGESEPHHLYDPDTPVFERGGVDVFLLCTFFPLGELQSIRLWHDNSGDSPSW